MVKPSLANPPPHKEISTIKQSDLRGHSRGTWRQLPYRRKFLRHEKFTKSLKTGFSRLFIRDTTPDIRESHTNVFSIKLYGIRSIVANVHLIDTVR